MECGKVKAKAKANTTVKDHQSGLQVFVILLYGTLSSLPYRLARGLRSQVDLSLLFSLQALCLMFPKQIPA